VPNALIAGAAGFLVWRGKRWANRAPLPAGVAPAGVEGYDAALDAELRKFDD
jgi:hypothetical protein